MSAEGSSLVAGCGEGGDCDSSDGGGCEEITGCEGGVGCEGGAGCEGIEGGCEGIEGGCEDGGGCEGTGNCGWLSVCAASIMTSSVLESTGGGAAGSSKSSLSDDINTCKQWVQEHYRPQVSVI